MDDIQAKLSEFKNIVIKNCNNPSFAYWDWMVNDHLVIVERIAMELCDIYQSADINIVYALVWFHDFGKPFDENNEYELTKTKGIEALASVGLSKEFIDKVLDSWTRMEMKETIDISKEPIEVQIVSTADGASHFVGKFYSTYFKDEIREDMKDLEKRLLAKIEKDWNRKIVLPEIKKAFYQRYLRAKEIAGEYPEKFLI
ncbi:MAG: HD domain-containing protein [bacterium]